MRLLTISNLYPRPDQPARGMFNARLFGAMATMAQVRNLCLVPEWKTWRWAGIRNWPAPPASRVPTRYIPAFHLPVAGRSMAAGFHAAALRREVADMRGTDAVLAAWLYPDGVAAAAVARDAGVPAWILVQGSDTFHLACAARRREILDAAGYVSGFFCVCKLLADRLVEAGLPAGKVHVTPNGVDPAEFSPLPRDESEKRLALSAPWAFSGVGRKRILFAGNLERVKGPDLALDAFERLLGKAGRASAELVFVGDGRMRKLLQRQVLDRRLEDCVFFAGSRPHGEMAAWMNVADVLLLTSRSEGMPNVILEALACGLAVAATDVGACREMLSVETCARVAKEGDAEDLARAVSDLLDAKCDRAELAARHGRRTWGDMAREIVERMKAEG